MNAQTYYPQQQQQREPIDTNEEMKIVGQVAAAYFSHNLIHPDGIKQVISSIREGLTTKPQAVEPQEVQEDTTDDWQDRPFVPGQTKAQRAPRKLTPREISNSI